MTFFLYFLSLPFIHPNPKRPLISKLKCLTTKPSSRPHRPKRSDPPKPVSCSSSPTTGITPTPYGHRYSAHRPPSSPVDDVLHHIASCFPPSEVDERLIVRSRMSYPTQLISLIDLKLRPIRCRRSSFPLTGNSLEMPSVLEIPSKIERSEVDHRLWQWNRRRRRPTNGSQTPPRRQPRHHLCSLSLISHPSPSTPWTSLPSASSPSPTRMSSPPLFSLILFFVGSLSPPSPRSSAVVADLLPLPLLHRPVAASCSSPTMPLLLTSVVGTCFCDGLFRTKRVCRRVPPLLLSLSLSRHGHRLRRFLFLIAVATVCRPPNHLLLLLLC